MKYKSTRGILLSITCICLLLVSLASLKSDASRLKIAVNQKAIAGHTVIKEYKSATGDNLYPGYLGLPRKILQDSNGDFWVGAMLSLYSYSEIKDQWNKVVDESSNKSPVVVDKICESQDKRIWITTLLDNSLRVYDGTKLDRIQKIGPHNISEFRPVIFNGLKSELWAVLEDSIYIYRNGEWNYLTKPPEQIQQSYTHYPARALASPLHSYVGIGDSSANRQPRLSTDTGRDSLNTLREILIGYQDREGIVWLGARRGILSFDERQQEWKTYLSPEGFLQPCSIYQDHEGKIWFGDEEGHISVYDKKNEGWTNYDISKAVSRGVSKNEGYLLSINAIFQDTNDQIMFATPLGLVTLFEKKNEWHYYSSQNSNLPDSNVTTIMQDHAGKIWVGTGKGLVVLEAT